MIPIKMVNFPQVRRERPFCRAGEGGIRVEAGHQAKPELQSLVNMLLN